MGYQASYFASSGSQSSRGSRFSSVWISGLKPSSPVESDMARNWPATSRHTPRVPGGGVRTVLAEKSVQGGLPVDQAGTALLDYRTPAHVPQAAEELRTQLETHWAAQICRGLVRSHLHVAGIKLGFHADTLSTSCRSLVLRQGCAFFFPQPSVQWEKIVTCGLWGKVMISEVQSAFGANYLSPNPGEHGDRCVRTLLRSGSGKKKD